ncbi:MAG: YcgN family cysteine cluster protein [Alphaproteobacteria bacterium]
MNNKFWIEKELEDLSEQEWESICNNCGKCCLVKVQDEDDDEIYYTNVVCKYFNHENCSCKEYERRCELVPECLKLTIDNIDKIEWMPKDCAYKTLLETKNLPDWHPLLTGKPLTNEHSIKGKCICETEVNEEDLEDHIVDEEDL